MVTSLKFLRLLEHQLNTQDVADWFWIRVKDWRIEIDPSSISNLQLPESITLKSRPFLLNTNTIFPLPTSNERLTSLFQGIYHAFQPVRDWLVGVWLHGSLATADFTPYSDVDVLLILRDEVLQNKQVYQQVKTAVLSALHHVFLFDPLQHHGFFVATPHTLANWPAAYLPAAALTHAYPLWQVKQSVVLHEYHHPTESVLLFQQLAQQIYHATLPHNLYKAKGLLSQFMLLPAAYCQAMGTPVYKRESFGLVQEQFAPFWQPMSEASQMRQTWAPPHRPFWPLLLRLLNPWLASRLYRPLERQLPPCRHYLNWEQLIQAMKKLTQAMEQTIQ